MPINADDDAPPFDPLELRTIDGTPFGDADLEGRWTLVAFHRYAACPVCDVTLQRYRQRIDELSEAGIQVIKLFHSSVDKLLDEMAPDDFPFPIVADPEQKAYRAWDVRPDKTAMFRPKNAIAALKSLGSDKAPMPWKSEGTISMYPADFIVDPERVVRFVQYGDDIGDSLSVDETLEAARRLGATAA